MTSVTGVGVKGPAAWEIGRLVAAPAEVAMGVLRAATAAPALQDALPILLAEIARGLAWPAAALWAPDDERASLHCSAFWSEQPDEWKKLERRSRDVALQPGEGVPGRTWRSRVPVADAGIPDDPRWARLDGDEMPGASIAFPLAADDRVLGVVELLDVAPRDVDAGLQRALINFGAVLGRGLARRLAEEVAGAERARLEAALAAGRMGVWDWDIRTNRIRWSDTLTGMAGLLPDDFGGTVEEFVESIHPHDRDWVLEVFLQALEGDDDHRVDVEYRAVRPDGDERWLHIVGRGIVDDAGAVAAMTGVALDVTDRVRREETTRMDAALLALALEVGGMGAWRWFADTNTGWWSEGLVEILGAGPEGGGDVTTDDAMGALHPDDHWALDAVVQAATDGRDVDLRYRVAITGGGYRWIRSIGRPLHDAAGDFVGIAGIVIPQEPAS